MGKSGFKRVRMVKDRKKVQTALIAEQIMKGIMVGEKLKIDSDIGKEYPDMATVNIHGKKIIVKDPSRFIEELKKATSFEYWGITDDGGTIEMDFSYNNLLAPEEEE